MGVIKLGDKIVMDPENSGSYSEFLRKGAGVVIGIHPMGSKDLDKTARWCHLDDVGHLTVRCDNGLVIIIGVARIAEINGFKRPDLREDDLPAAVKREPGTVGVRVKKKATPQAVKKQETRKKVPRKRGFLHGLWG